MSSQTVRQHLRRRRLSLSPKFWGRGWGEGEVSTAQKVGFFTRAAHPACGFQFGCVTTAPSPIPLPQEGWGRGKRSICSLSPFYWGERAGVRGNSPHRRGVGFFTRAARTACGFQFGCVTTAPSPNPLPQEDGGEGRSICSLSPILGERAGVRGTLHIVEGSDFSRVRRALRAGFSSVV